MTWFYCSFADTEKGWLGALHIEGEDIDDALERAWRMGVNPGGEVMFGALPDGLVEEKLPVQWRGVLMNKEQLEEVCGELVQLEPGTDVSKFNAAAINQGEE